MYSIEEELKDINDEQWLNMLKDITIPDLSSDDTLPKPGMLFNCFRYTPFNSVRVVILGQDPYPSAVPEYAHGLAFSSKANNKLPPSLMNIFKEIISSCYPDSKMPSSGSLVHWAEQGVLLLNTALTVKVGKPLSHIKHWEPITDSIIKKISDQHTNIIFLLMGRAAQAKASLIDISKHKIITTTHPSPLSANKGFFGSNVFKNINEILERPIMWLPL